MMEKTISKKYILIYVLISALAAVMTAALPWFQTAYLGERVGILSGLFSVYFIIFFWMGKQIRSWIEYRRRVKAMAEIVGALSEIRLDVLRKAKKDQRGETPA